jgi:hypothetical protein
MDARRDGRPTVVVRTGPFRLPGAHAYSLTLYSPPRKYLVRVDFDGDAVAVRTNQTAHLLSVERQLPHRRQWSAPNLQALTEWRAGLPRRRRRLVVAIGSRAEIGKWQLGRRLTPLEPLRLAAVGETAVVGRGLQDDRLAALAHLARANGATAWLSVCGLGSWNPLADPNLGRLLGLPYDLVEFWLPDGYTRVQRSLLTVLPGYGRGWRANPLTHDWTTRQKRPIARLAQGLKWARVSWSGEAVLESIGHVRVDLSRGLIEYAGTGDSWRLGPNANEALWAALQKGDPEQATPSG